MSKSSNLSRSPNDAIALCFGLIVFGAILSGAAVVILGPGLSIAGMLLVFAGILCLVRPALYMQVLLVVLLAVPAGFTTTHIFSIQVGAYNILYTDVLVGIVVLRWSLDRVSSRGRSFTGGVVLRRLSALVAVLLMYSIFSLFRGLLEFDQFAQSMYDARPIFYYVIILIAFDYLQTLRSLERLTSSILIGLFLYSIFVLSYFLAPSGHPLAAAQELNTWASTNRIGFSNGNYFVLAIPIALMLLADRRVATYARIEVFLGLIVYFAVLVLSMSRTNVVTSVLSIALFHIVYSHFYHSRTRINNSVIRMIVVIAVLLAGILIAFDQVIPFTLGDTSQSTLDVFFRRFDLSSAAAYEAHVVPRIVMLRTAISLILQNPILGYGFGYQFALQGWSSLVTFVDNSFLTAWIRLGLVGFLSLIGLIVMLLQSTQSLLRHARPSHSLYAQILVASLAGGAIPLLSISLNASWLVSSSAVIPLIIIAGAIMGFSTQHESESVAKPN